MVSMFDIPVLLIMNNLKSPLHPQFTPNPSRVSSTLDDDAQFDKRHLIDGKLETCWNSEEGESHFVYYKFSQPVSIAHLELTFQGGFGAEHLAVSVGVPVTDDDADDDGDVQIEEDDDDDNEAVTKKRQIGLRDVAEFNSQDASSTQSFSFEAKDVHAVKITFTNMADMFGRVILYNLNVYGPEEKTE